MKNSGVNSKANTGKVVLNSLRTLSEGSQLYIDPMVSVTGQSHWRRGTVTYVNEENGWFLVEYTSSRDNHRLRNTYRFYDVGKKVFFEDRKAA